MGMMNEFKEFAMRGNVMDLAVGVIIGAAFGKIVSALVDGILMPMVGSLIGGVNFSELAVQLSPAQIGADGKETAAAVLIKYGAFIQTIVDFLIVALVVFLVVKMMNRMKKAEVQAPEIPAAPAQDIVLLTEIRDLLKSK